MRRSRFEKCSGADADYLRVLGNRGQADAFYCGQDSAPNATFAAGDAVALLFKTSPREEKEAETRRDISCWLFGSMQIDFVGFTLRESRPHMKTSLGVDLLT